MLNYNGYKVVLKKNRYADNGNLYVGLDYYDEELEGFCPFGNITVNTDVEFYNKFLGAVDTNNMGNDILVFLEDNNIAEKTGEVVQSGFCTYPVYKFSEMKLTELCK